MTEMLQIAMIAFTVSLLMCGLIVHWTPYLGKLALDTSVGPQKFHSHAVARIGGLGLFLGFTLSAALGQALGSNGSETSLLLAASAVPSLAAGLAEDVTKRVGPLPRLVATMASAAVCIWLLGATITRLDVPFLDKALQFTWVSVAFTCFAVGGIANAVNIIDGYNGLAGGVCIVVLAAIALVCWRVNDHVLLLAALTLLAALAGFMFWNYPKGRLFLGDGGAYLTGFLIAELGVLLVQRNASVSPWFPLLLLAYPVWETFFSIYRKKFLRQQSPGQPDGLHFHMLVFKRCVRIHQFNRDHNARVLRNAGTSPYLWLLAVICAIPAILWWNNSFLLVISSFSFAGLYNLLYSRLIHFRVPPWLILR